MGYYAGSTIPPHILDGMASMPPLATNDTYVGIPTAALEHRRQQQFWCLLLSAQEHLLCYIGIYVDNFLLLVAVM
eukprot:6577118-Ditylum_brightwellii.AAC.1